MATTPKELFYQYIKDKCSICTKEGECNIHLASYNGKTAAKCTEFKQIDYCMKHRCNGCMNNKKCFGGGNNGE